MTKTKEKTGAHAVVEIHGTHVRFDISDDLGSGSEPFGGKAHHFTVEAAWRAVERVLAQRDVATTEVHDYRKCAQCGKPTENSESWCSEECYEDSRPEPDSY